MQIHRRLLIAIVTVAVVLTAVPAFAQGTGQTQVNTGLGIGANVGFTFTNVRTETNTFNTDLGGDKGLLLGIFFGGNRDGRTGLLGEFNYVTRKTKVDDVLEKITSVQIPVLFRVNMGYRERDKPSGFIHVGPVFDIQIKSQIGANSPDDVYQGLNIGLGLGGGFEVVRVGIEARYVWGLKSVLATDAAVDGGFGSKKLDTFYLIFKIRFN
jgi:hypothetical protein